MKKEYDFSKGERGKFYRPNARFNLPVYLDADARKIAEAIAKSQRSDVTEVVNKILKSDLRLVRAPK